MGGSGASAPERAFLDGAISHGREEDPRFGAAAFHHAREDPARLFVSKKLWTDSSRESAAVAELLGNRHAVTHPNLARLLSYEKAPRPHSMTTFTRHIFVWEYFDHDLERDIATKQAGSYSSAAIYTEPQLWYFLNAALGADLALQRGGGGLYHGNLQPATLLLDPAGAAKLVDNRALFPTATTYDRLLHDRSLRAALSPGLMRELSRGAVCPRFDPSREDSWALGLTGLCAACGKGLDDYYDWRGGKVRLDEIEADLQSLEGLYSLQLVSFLRNCLQEDELQRLPLEAHEEFLASFQTAIYALQLDFARRAPRVLYNDVVETKVFYETDVRRTDANNDIIIGNSNFFAGAQPAAPRSEAVPAGGNFFDAPEIIDLLPARNAYALSSPGQSRFF